MSLASDSDRNDDTHQAAYRELERLVRLLGEELAGFRRRAMQAESKLKALDSGGNGAPVAPSSQRLSALERENARLRTRLETAAERTRQMLERVRFLRQQHAHKGGDR